LCTVKKPQFVLHNKNACLIGDPFKRCSMEFLPNSCSTLVSKYKSTSSAVKTNCNSVA
jgi:hypothetical protein